MIHGEGHPAPTVGLSGLVPELALNPRKKKKSQGWPGRLEGMVVPRNGDELFTKGSGRFFEDLLGSPRGDVFVILGVDEKKALIESKAGYWLAEERLGCETYKTDRLSQRLRGMNSHRAPKRPANHDDFLHTSGAHPLRRLEAISEAKLELSWVTIFDKNREDSVSRIVSPEVTVGAIAGFYVATIDPSQE